jgi:tetratricopeptide (TPR) repeat protein
MARSGDISSESETAWRAVLARDPFDVAALHGIGRILLRRKRPAQAIALLSAAAATEDADAEVLCDLGTAFVAAGLIGDAEPWFRRTLEVQPDHFQALSGLGGLLLGFGRAEAALGLLRQAMLVAPEGAGTTVPLAGALIGAGNAAYGAGDMAAAERLYREAMGCGVDMAAGYSNLGNALTGQLRIDEAQEAYRAALAIDPVNDAAGFAYSLCLLLSGDDAEGWRWYECRRRVDPLRRDHERHPDLPQWRPGVDLAGQRVLLTAEQGSGDLLQYARFAPALGQIAAAVVLEMPWPLAALFRGMAGIERVAELDDVIRDCDIACPLLSLPLLLGPDAGVEPPYVGTRPERVGRWKTWLDRSGPGRRIGLVCSGDPRHPRDRDRSIPLSMLAPLLEVEGVAFVLVQTEIRDSDRAALDSADNLRCPAAALTDYADTAALVAGLDLVISVDSSVAHLAGAMGVPVWVLLPFCPDYRWGLGREESRWYPSMRLFRQERPGEWGAVVQLVAGALRAD